MPAFGVLRRLIPPCQGRKPGPRLEWQPCPDDQPIQSHRERRFRRPHKSMPADLIRRNGQLLVVVGTMLVSRQLIEH